MFLDIVSIQRMLATIIIFGQNIYGELILFFFFFVLLGPHVQHMEVPRVGAELEL